MTEPVIPDYDGACVASIVPSLLGARARDWLPEPAREARTVVLFVIDGLGWSEIQKHRARLPNISSMHGGPITSVVPSTTASVLTSITTGVAPAEHGIVGFRMRVGVHTLNVLRWTTTPDGPAPDPVSMQPVKPFGGKSVPVVSRSHFKVTGFSDAHMRGVRYFGWFATSTLVERCRLLAASGEKFVYAYYDGIDHLAHARGLADSFYEVELDFVDRMVGDLLEVLPESAALLVTADHGQVDLPDDSWVSLGEDLLSLAEAHSCDARFRFLHAREGASGDLLAGARERFTDRAWVYSREELLESGALGPARPRDDVVARIGDVVLAARAPVAFVDPALPEEVRLRSGHGSMTREEMLVPLIAARGRAR